MSLFHMVRCDWCKKELPFSGCPSAWRAATLEYNNGDSLQFGVRDELHLCLSCAARLSKAIEAARSESEVRP